MDTKTYTAEKTGWHCDGAIFIINNALVWAVTREQAEKKLNQRLEIQRLRGEGFSLSEACKLVRV